MKPVSIERALKESFQKRTRQHYANSRKVHLWIVESPDAQCYAPRFMHHWWFIGILAIDDT